MSSHEIEQSQGSKEHSFENKWNCMEEGFLKFEENLNLHSDLSVKQHYGFGRDRDTESVRHRRVTQTGTGLKFS